MLLVGGPMTTEEILAATADDAAPIRPDTIWPITAHDRKLGILNTTRQGQMSTWHLSDDFRDRMVREAREIINAREGAMQRGRNEQARHRHTARAA